nr:hypothetical protein [Tanacetum cinerariifolium]
MHLRSVPGDFICGGVVVWFMLSLVYKVKDIEDEPGRQIKKLTLQSVRVHDEIDSSVGNAGRKHVIDEIGGHEVRDATPESLDTEPAPATFGPFETATARTVEKGAGE